MTKTTIKFTEENHSYTVNGKDAISVTQILKATGLTPAYDGVPEHILKMAADRGNYYDQQADEAITDPFELTEWQIRFLDLLKENQMDALQSQLRVGTETPFPIAGTADFLFKNEKTKKEAIVDLKATAMIYENSVTWQTNFYSYLYNKKNHDNIEKYVLHYNEKDDLFTFLKLKHIPTNIIEDVILAYQLGEPYVENALINTFPLEVFNATFERVREYEDKLKEAKKELDVFYDKLKEQMKATNTKSFEIENFKITYTPETTRKSYDYKQLTEDLNVDDITLAKYLKETSVKDKLTVTKRK